MDTFLVMPPIVWPPLVIVPLRMPCASTWPFWNTKFVGENVPVNATDDYITKLAQLFKANLSPDLSVYIEYSNEVWNGSFQQANDDLTAAIAEEGNAGAHGERYGARGFWHFFGDGEVVEVKSLLVA